MANNDNVSQITDYDALDPLREQYQESLITTPVLRQELREHHVALLCIDLQYLDARAATVCLPTRSSRGSRPRHRSTTSTAWSRRCSRTCAGCRMRFASRGWR